jgi:hypothetical protein
LILLHFFDKFLLTIWAQDGFTSRKEAVMYTQAKLPPVTETVRGDFFWQRAKSGQRLIGGDKGNSVTLEAGSRYVGGKGFDVVDVLGAARVDVNKVGKNAAGSTVYARGSATINARDNNRDTLFLSGANNITQTDANDQIILNNKVRDAVLLGKGGTITVGDPTVTFTRTTTKFRGEEVYRYAGSNGVTFVASKALTLDGNQKLNIVT